MKRTLPQPKAKLSKIRPTLEVHSRRTIHKDERTYTAGMLASLGFSNAAIVARTGLRPHAVTYRLHQAGVRISDYRSGKGNVASFVLSYATKFATEDFASKLREKLGLP